MGEEVAVVLEPPRPKSPPRYPDLCGRRRSQLELQMLNREIEFLKVRHRRQRRSFLSRFDSSPLTCPNLIKPP
jgi:hypothetical protein